MTTGEAQVSLLYQTVIILNFFFFFKKLYKLMDDEMAIFKF